MAMAREWSEREKDRIIQICRDLNEFDTLDDGFEAWFPSKCHSFIRAYELRLIADELDRLNEPMRNSVDNYFKGDNVSCVSYLTDCFNELQIEVSTATPDQIRNACKIILAAESISKDEAEALRWVFSVPASKENLQKMPHRATTEHTLVAAGLLTYVAVDGYFLCLGCTAQGAWVCSILDIFVKQGKERHEKENR